MAASRTPFLFCRYAASIDDEELDASGLTRALNDIQGTFLPHGAKAEQEGNNTIVVMRPRKESIHSLDIVTWFVGHRPGHRTVADYDAVQQELSFAVEPDTNIVHTQVIAIPEVGVMAVNDRTNALHMGGRSALSRTRSVFKQIPGGHFDFTFLSPGDIQQVVNSLALEEYSYTVRRINPTPPSALAAALDETMASEGIGINKGTARPMPGGVMHAGEGTIGATRDLASAGYGVVGFKGTTEGGHTAQIRKPPFSLDKEKNIKQQEKEQPLRVIIETEGDDHEILEAVVAELIRFYVPNE